MNVKAQVVVGQLGGLFLQLPGESDLPVAGNTQTHLFRESAGRKRLRLSETAHSVCTQLGVVASYSDGSLQLHFLLISRSWLEKLHCSVLQMVYNHVCNLNSDMGVR